MAEVIRLPCDVVMRICRALPMRLTTRPGLGLLLLLRYATGSQQVQAVPSRAHLISGEHAIWREGLPPRSV